MDGEVKMVDAVSSFIALMTTVFVGKYKEWDLFAVREVCMNTPSIISAV